MHLHIPDVSHGPLRAYDAWDMAGAATVARPDVPDPPNNQEVLVSVRQVEPQQDREKERSAQLAARVP